MSKLEGVTCPLHVTKQYERWDSLFPLVGVFSPDEEVVLQAISFLLFSSS